MTSEIDLLASFVADLEHIKANETNEETKETLGEVINYLNNKSYQLEKGK